MAKLPREPDLEHLKTRPPDIFTILKGTMLYRMYRRGGRHPSAWNAMRPFGPTDARFDHQERNADGQPWTQERGIFYAATDVETAFAEIFQEARIVNRRRGRPWLASFAVTRDINLLDLTDTFPLRAGGSMKLVSCPKAHSRNWSRGFYECYPDIEGLYYPSSMTNRPIVALYERILDDDPFPAEPFFDRPLTDDRLVELIHDVRAAIGYGLA